MSLVRAMRMYLLDRPAWEAACDRCGRCCFEREVGPQGDVELNYAAPCELLDLETHLCRDYAGRLQACSRCHQLTPFHALFSRHLPRECAYVRRFRARRR